MSWQSFTKDYLTFSKKDRIGIIVVLLIVAVIYFLPHFFARSANGMSMETDSAILRAIDTLNTSRSKGYTYYNKEEKEARKQSYSHEPGFNRTVAKGELFTFDPNVLPAEGWQRLGLKEKTSKTIENYRNKGGKFYKPEDIKKIWGLPDGFYERVKDYVQITSVSASVSKTALTASLPGSPKFEKEERKITAININAADTSALIALPGIGSRLASRIVNFRDKLGGFYSVDQISETYGLSDSTFQKLKPLLKIKSGEIKKININTAGKDELKVHPYIRWNLANAIVEYRNQHGNFGSVDDLKKIAIMEDVLLEKMRPYLTVE